MNRFDLLLADDDEDDRALFADALAELDIPVSLTTVPDGEQLMQFLGHSDKLPGAVFLDLNMPRKNGVECLTEIRENEKLKQLKVIIFSTSFDRDVISQLYNKGAQNYIRKPYNFDKLKKVLRNALDPLLEAREVPGTIEHFVIEP